MGKYSQNETAFIENYVDSNLGGHEKQALYNLLKQEIFRKYGIKRKSKAIYERYLKIKRDKAIKRQVINEVTCHIQPPTSCTEVSLGDALITETTPTLEQSPDILTLLAQIKGLNPHERTFIQSYINLLDAQS